MKNRLLSLFTVVLTIVGAASTAANAQSLLTNGLVSYYPFDGNANDKSGPNNGTAVGATLTADRFGNANSAYHFDGGSWIQTLQYRMLDGASNATFSMWVTIDAGTGGQILSSGDARIGFDPISLHFADQSTSLWLQNCLVSDGANSLIGSAGGSSSLTNLTAGVWHQIVVVLSTSDPSGTMNIYVDGAMSFFRRGSGDGLTPFTKIAYDRNMRFLIGALEARPDYATPGQFWSGNIDDVRIFNRALTSTEVQQLYAYEAAPTLKIYTAIELDFSPISGHTCQYQSSSNFVDWVNVGASFAGGDQPVQQFFSIHGTSARFYRIDDVTP